MIQKVFSLHTTIIESSTGLNQVCVKC